jgi:hypothetical protein
MKHVSGVGVFVILSCENTPRNFFLQIGIFVKILAIVRASVK